MKLLDMLCPHGWNNCIDCKNVDLCKAGLYKPESSDLDILIQAAKVAEEVVTKEAIESAHKIKGTWMEELDQVTGTDEFWAWFAKYRIPNPTAIEPWKTMSGPSEPGGSKMKCKKETKGTKPTIYKWNEFE